MNSFKIALSNIKKSVKDYTVYFFTLVLGVMIFYIFNSMKDQTVIQSISGSSNVIISILFTVLEAVSVVVAFVLGILILYANSFLIKRRNKEFGIYLTLGMSRRDVSKILLAETFLIGLVSLVIGLILGLFSSQLVSILVGKMFEVDLSIYRFSFSFGALIKTVVNFAIIYLVVMLFNTVSITKLKLIDLITSGKKNEKQLIKRPLVSSMVFLISASVLTYCCYCVWNHPEGIGRNELIRIIFLGCFSTIGIFVGLSGLVVKVFAAFPKTYNKGLNSFIVRSFGRSANSSAILMGVICLMLFFSLTLFATGFSINLMFTRDLKSKAPVDISLECDTNPVSDCISTWDYNLYDDLHEYENVTTYKPMNCNVIDCFNDKLSVKDYFSYANWDMFFEIISLSDYNRVAKLYAKDELSLNDNEYAIVANMSIFTDCLDEYLQGNNLFTICETELTPRFDHSIPGFIMLSNMSVNPGIVIIPDCFFEGNRLAEDYRFSSDYLLGNFNTDKSDKVQEILAKVNTLVLSDPVNQNVPVSSLYVESKQNIYESSNAIALSVIFVVLYLGIIFMISAAAILALKTLSGCLDTVNQYEILSKIGTEEKLISKALFAQIGMFFLIPLAVAIIECVTGMRYIKQLLSIFDMNNAYSGIIFAVCLELLIYIGYMIATYSTGKRIIRLDRQK